MDTLSTSESVSLRLRNQLDGLSDRLVFICRVLNATWLNMDNARGWPREQFPPPKEGYKNDANSIIFQASCSIHCVSRYQQRTKVASDLYFQRIIPNMYFV